MKKRLLSALLAVVLTMLPAAAFAAEGPDYQTALIAQLEAGVRPSENNLFFGISQWKAMEEGTEKRTLSMRYAAVRKLDMSDMGLTQSSSSDDLDLLEPFTGLEELNLSTKEDTAGGNRNALNNLNSLAGLTNLRRLDVSNNQLEAKSGMTGGISGLQGCARLETLNLSGNKRLGSTRSVKDALAPLAGLSSLRELDLSDTAFSDSDVESVRAAASLRVLDISNTPVKDLDLSGLSGLISLTARNLTLDSLKLPRGIAKVDLRGTTLKVKADNEDDAIAVTSAYGDSGLELVDRGSTSQKVYIVTVADTVNGAVEVSQKTATKGTKVAITTAPSEGYVQDSVIISYEGEDGELVSEYANDGQFAMPDGNVTVTVRFMPLNVRIQYNETGHGTVSFKKELPIRGERVDFAADLSRGFQVRQITAKLGSKTVPVYRREDGMYCFDMPRIKEGETLIFDVAIVEVVTAKYSRTGSSEGRLTLSGLVEGQRYVCQMSEAGSGSASGSCTIVTFMAQDTTELLNVRNSTNGYVVSLWKYDSRASSVADLTNVFYEVTAR